MDFFFRASFESVPPDAVFPCAPEADAPVDDAFSDTVFLMQAVGVYSYSRCIRPHTVRFSGSLKCKNTLCDPVKEIPVMGYRDDYSVIAIQIIL